MLARPLKPCRRFRTASRFAGLLLLGLLPLATGAGTMEHGETAFAGMSLADALLELRARGLKIVFTSEVVRSEMTVGAEPVGAEPRQILDELLEPHGLMARDGPRSTLVVVRRGSGDSPPEAAARESGEPRPDSDPDTTPVLQETIEVTPSRISLLRDEPGAAIGFDRDEIQSLPHLGGDFFRAVSLAPGISGNDVSAQFNVRGARSDETQILLDGQELFEPFHLKDFDSALSFVASSTLRSADLATGGFAAEFGDRMSGVLDMATVTPSGPPRGRVGISSLNLHAGGSGGFGDGRGGWLVETRRGTTDLVDKMLGNEDPRYADAYGKFEYRINDRNRLSFHLLFSDDRFRYEENLEDESKAIDTGYRSSYFWLEHAAILGDGMLVETALSLAGLDQDRRGVESEETVQFDVLDQRNSEVLGLRQGWTWRAAPRHLLQWGFELRAFDTEYDYASSFVFDDPLSEIRDDPEEGSRVFVGEFEENHSGLYFSDRMLLAEPLTLELGLRYDRHTLTDENHLSPRVNLAWALNETSVLRVAWGRFLQSQRPYELQVEDGETEFHATERSDHRVLGFEKLFGRDAKSGGLNFRAEIYKRRVSNPRPRYENLYEALNTFPELEPDRIRIAPDRSTAQGVELFLQGRAGKRLGWFANYAWAKTEDEIDGQTVPRQIDQRHALNLDLDCRLGAHWRLNLAGRYHSGWPITPLTLEEEDDGEGGTVYVPVLGPLNSERLPAYHRLDLRASREFRTGGGGLIVFFIDVQNLYNRKNIAGFDVEIDEEEGTALFEEEYWAGILPSLGVSYEF